MDLEDRMVEDSSTPMNSAYEQLLNVANYVTGILLFLLCSILCGLFRTAADNLWTAVQANAATHKLRGEKKLAVWTKRVRRTNDALNVKRNVYLKREQRLSYLSEIDESRTQILSESQITIWARASEMLVCAYINVITFRKPNIDDTTILG